MGLIYRTSSLANAGASSIKNAELTYEEGDGNIAFLLTNLSGSNVSIDGNTTVNGPIQLNGTLQADGIIYASNLTSASQNYTVTYDTGSGRLYYTASSAILGAAPTLQQVTDKGNITTNNIEILGQALSGNQGVNLYAGTNGLSGTPARVYIYDNTLGDSKTLTILGTEYSSSGYSLSIARPILGSSYVLTYPTTGGFFAISVNSTASNAAGNITITTVPTASFVTASNVFGPHGSSSVVSSSYAISSSFAQSASYIPNLQQVTNQGATTTNSISVGNGSFGSDIQVFAIGHGGVKIGVDQVNKGYINIERGSGIGGIIKSNNLSAGRTYQLPDNSGTIALVSDTGSLLTTASVSLNTITFTKGDGSTFPITVNTGSGGGGGGTSAPSDTYIQYNSGSTFGATGSFRFIYASQSLQQGNNVQAKGQYSHAEGIETIASGSYSHAEGASTQAIGQGSHAEGESTQAIGNYSHAEGYQTKTGTQNAYSASIVNGIVTMSAAYPNASSQFGADNRMYLYDVPFDNNYGRATFIISQSYYNSPNTIVELYDTSVNTTTAYVGNLTEINVWNGDQTIPGDYSHTEGDNTQAIGDISHAEGSSTQAIGYASHAEGSSTQAIGDISHAEGAETQAIGYNSHAEGNNTIASGSYSHAEGQYTQAVGQSSHAEGSGTVALGDYQHVQGQFNISSSVQSAFIVGNGTNDLNRSNLIFAAGNTVQITGSLNVTGSAFLRGLSNTTQANVLTYNSSTGQVFFTASSAIGGGGSPIDTSTFLTTGSLSTTQQLSGSLNITGSLNFFSGSQQQLQIQNGILILSQVSASLNFANDAAAAAGGVPLGGLYRNGNAISIRIV